MLGLAQFQHEISKNRKIVYSFTLVALLVFSGFLGAFIHLDRKGVTAATITSEDFDDLGDWEQLGGTNVVSSTYRAHTGSYSGFVSSDTSGTCYMNQTISLSDSTFTFNIWVNINVSSSPQYMTYLATSDEQSPTDVVYIMVEANETLALRVKDEDGASVNHFSNPEVTLVEDVWYNLTVIGNNNRYTLWSNGTEVVNVSYTSGDTFTFVSLGDRSTGSGVGDFYLDDFLLTDTADYPSSSGYPEINEGVFQSSLTNVGGVYCITFNGSQGEVVWSNSSGSGSENMTVSISDGNQSVTWINVSLTDVGTSPYIDAEDIYLYASETEASGYVAIYAFPISGGGNVTVNASTWTGDDPFPISGADIVYFRFRLTIDADQANQTYSETTGCKVWIGG